jgi:DNA-binding protein HU-beta
MNKKELIASIAKNGGITKTSADQALNAMLAMIGKAVSGGDRVTLSGFGSFRVVERKEKKGRNPQTGQSLIIPAHNIVKFTPGRNLYSRIQ